MRKVLLSLGLAGVALAAAPAAAQGYYGQGSGYNGGYGYDRGYGNDRYRDDYRNGASQELRQLSQRVERGVQRGDLNRREADYFRREIAQLRYLDRQYGSGGYNGYERQQLDQRIDRLRDRLRFERRNDDRRGEGRWDRGDDRRW